MIRTAICRSPTHLPEATKTGLFIPTWYLRVKYLNVTIARFPRSFLSVAQTSSVEDDAESVTKTAKDTP